MSSSVMVSYALVFCRFMGSDDESSTDEEQAEKLLYFYPSSLSIGERLSKINMVEGLIEFTNKFSKEKLGSIVMDNDIWGFYECEPQVWIAIAVPRRKEIPEIDGRFCHRSSAKGVSLFLQQFYQLFSTFNGSIYKSLEGSNLVGFEIIDRVRDLRKNIRKLTKALDQSRRDESFVSSISSDNIVNNETINEHNISVVGNYKSLVDIQKEAELIEEQLAAKGSALEVIINSQSYTPDKVREFLNRFMQLCLQQENPTFFSHLTPSLGYRRAEINSLMHLPLCRMREAVAESSQNLILGMITLNEGSMVWTDLDNATASSVYNFVTLQETKYFQNSIYEAAQRTASSVFQALSSDTANKSDVSLANLENADACQTVQKAVETFTDQRGYVVAGWDVVDLDDSIFHIMEVSKDLYEISTKTVESSFAAQHSDDVLSDHCIGPYKLFCPRIYNDGGCLGRAVFYKYKSFLLIYLLPDWPLGAYGPKFHSRHVESIYESISNANSTDGANSTLSVEKSSENHSGASKEFFIGNLSILTLCATIQHAITGELDRLNDKSKKNCVLRTNNLNDLNKKKKGADESGTERPRSVSPVSRNFRGILKATSENAAFVKDKLNSSRRSTGSYDYKKKDVNSVAPCLRYLMYDSVRKSYKISNMYKGLHHAAMMHPSTFTAALKKMEYMQGHQTGLISNLFKIVSENLKCDLTWMYPTPSKLLADFFEPQIVRAIETIAMQLSDPRIARKCIRVSTIQHGGVWVFANKKMCIGYPLSTDEFQILYAVIENCAILNDASDMFDELLELL